MSVVVIMLVGCLPVVQSEEFVPRNPIVYGLTLLPSGFDPHIHASAELGIPLRQVYDTLVYRDPVTQEFVPGLATAWVVSEDGLTYTFTLRQGVTFHDGTPFNAAAVAANLDRITDPATASQKAVFMLGSYVGYELVDDYTIRLLLAEPYSPLLDSLSQVYLGIASPTALSQFSTNRYQFHQVGTGPFEFVEYIPGDSMTLQRSQNYAWGPRFYTTPGEDAVDQIEYRFFSDEATRSLALESGEAQVMGELPPFDARALTGNNRVQIIPATVPGQPLQFLMNTQRFPTDTLQVRQALIFATNREAIVDTVFQGFSPPAWGPLSANTIYYNPSMQGVYPPNTALAQDLLAQSGLTDEDDNGFLEFNAVEATIRVIVPPWGLVPEVAQLLQDQWQTIGLRVELVPVPTFNGLVEAVNTGEYNLVAFNQFGADPALLNQFFRSDGNFNWTGYNNSELDARLDEATRQTDPQARRDLYGDVQIIIMNEALILPIRDYVNLNGATTSLANLQFDAYGWFPMMNNVSVFTGTTQ